MLSNSLRAQTFDLSLWLTRAISNFTSKNSPPLSIHPMLLDQIHYLFYDTALSTSNMPSDKELLTTELHEQQTDDVTYAEDWTDESIFWSRNGVYQKVAHHIPAVRRGELHIDLGSGVGLLPLTLARKNALGTIIGIDRNAHMLRHARSLHSELQEFDGVPIPLQIHHSEVMALMPDGSVKSFYIPAEEAVKIERGEKSTWVSEDARTSIIVGTNDLNEARMYPTPNPNLDRPGAKLIIDDLTRLNLTRHFLGDRKVQSISSTFPGTSARILKEAGIKHGDYERAQAVFTQRDKEKKQKEMEFVAERLAPGGTLTLVSRVPVDLTENERGRKRAGESFQEQLRGYEDQFNPNYGVTFMGQRFRNPTNGRIAWANPRGKGTLNEARVAIVQFKKK